MSSSALKKCLQDWWLLMFYWMLTKCQALCFMLLSHSMFSAILSEKYHHYPYFTGMQVEFEASRSRFSTQGHTLSSWDMNSDFFRNSCKPALLASYYWLPIIYNGTGKGTLGNKEWGGQHPCCHDTYNLSGDGIWNMENTQTT